ncbi:MAG: CPBP family intramembrane metalloprotease, partial [bacterium]|nr:CPBP family intramembrane metalloprotease [bacterium]
HGFPRGGIGVGLATVYGLILGLVWNRSRGMLAPWVAHVLADSTIVGILLFVA